MSVIPALIDVVLSQHDGYRAAQQAADTSDVLASAARDAGAIVTAFPNHLWIEPRDWKAIPEQNDINHTWPLAYLDRYTNQGPGNGGYSTHEFTHA